MPSIKNLIISIHLLHSPKYTSSKIIEHFIKNCVIIYSLVIGEDYKMGVSVAEYFGQRTDIDTENIIPVEIPPKKTEREKLHWNKPIPICPFTSGNPCKKLNSSYEPICSVRKPDGTLWICCSDRLCATKKNIALSAYQSNILLDVGKHIFSSDVTKEDICVKREERLSVIEGTNYNADYIITLKNGRSPFSGPDRMILEMQGGGETTNTGNLTNHVKSWRESSLPLNSILRKNTKASTLETNAWRRQQEQFIVKGNIAMKTWKGYGMTFCVGTLLFDYLMDKLVLANLPDLHHYNWTLAVIAFKEDTFAPISFGPIPLIVDEDRMLFTNYQTFVQALINQGEPSLNAFRGSFINLNNEEIFLE